MKYYITNVKWDFSDLEKEVGFEISKTSDIPTEFDIELDDSVKNLTEEEIEDIISNYISELYGFCHKGFKFEKIN